MAKRISESSFEAINDANVSSVELPAVSATRPGTRLGSDLVLYKQKQTE